MAKKIVILGIDHSHYKAILKAVQKRTDVLLTAVAQETAPYSDAVAAEYGVKSYRNYRECLDREEPDVVGMAMFNGARGPWVVEALQRNIPVIIDKPLCTDLAQLEKIKTAYMQSSVPLCMMLTCRNNPVYAAMKNAVISGETGEILFIAGTRYYALRRSQRPDWMFHRQSYGGPGLDILIHDYDLSRWMTGLSWDDVRLTELKSSGSADPDFHDLAFLSAVEGSRFLSLQMAWHSPSKHLDSYSVYGTRGCVQFSLNAECPVLINGDGQPRQLVLPEVEPFADQFFRAWLDEDVEFPIDGEESIAVVENLLKAGDSATLR